MSEKTGFFLWRSDHRRGDWNGTVVGWLFSCHIPPVAVTWPLSQARGLIQSQRRGHWLLPGLREETLGIMWGGVGQGRNVFFWPFCNEIQRFKVNGLPNWGGSSHDNTNPDHESWKFAAKWNSLHCKLTYTHFLNSEWNNAVLSISEWIGLDSKSQLRRTGNVYAPRTR